ncbi:MAG: TIGR03790 family protein, partial [Burkholderiales bacterium]
MQILLPLSRRHVIVPRGFSVMTGLRSVLWFVVCAGLALCGPALALDRTQLGVIINTRDPLSVEIGEYYVERRGIPPENVIRVSFTPIENVLPRARFELLKAQIDAQAPPQVEAYAVAWTAPYRVECMSITAALAFGFDPAFCAEGCKPTRPSRYYNSPASLPFTGHQLRPAMLLAAANFEQARALIDRGIASDATFPRGTAYLLATSDGARNVRSVWYPLIEQEKKDRLRVRSLRQDELREVDDVLFYFTGRSRVEGLETLRFVPGAAADHLTSFGGALTSHGGQMSALRWLEAGATGSYGAVVEPCNLQPKFPNPLVLIDRYLRGDTLIEAYWKSVQMPG